MYSNTRIIKDSKNKDGSEVHLVCSPALLNSIIFHYLHMHVDAVDVMGKSVLLVIVQIHSEV